MWPLRVFFSSCAPSGETLGPSKLSLQSFDGPSRRAVAQPDFGAFVKPLAADAVFTCRRGILIRG